MIRFSHSANSWQVAYSSDYWMNISVNEARALFDENVPLWHQSKLIVI